MDVSLEYIKMCEKANKAGLHKCGIGQNERWFCTEHRCFLTASDSLHGLAWQSCPKAKWNGDREHYRPDCNGKSICIYSQDQLQEMLGEKSVCRAMLEKITMFYRSKAFQQQRNGVPTYEQLWLAFVMKERFGKIWDGIEWHVESRS